MDFDLLDYLIAHAFGVSSIGVYHHISNLEIKRLTYHHQILDYLLGISVLQQRSMSVARGPINLLFDTRAQINHQSAFLQPFAIFFVEDSTPSGR